MENKNRVNNNAQKHRFELTLGEDKAAFIQYAEMGEGVLALTHTEVPDEFEGQGVGSTLIRGTFEIIEAQGLKIVPMCSFVAAYLRRHPEYQSLVES